MKKSKTWILRDYSHITQMIILVNDMSEPILPEESHWTLDRLEEITDLHFVFTETAIRRIDPLKFSEAYQASSYSVTPDWTGISGILGEMEYDRELYRGQHLYYFVTDLSKMRHINHEEVGKIIGASEVLKKSLYKVTRLSPETLAKQYMKPEAWYKRIERWNLYTTHKTTDKVLVIRQELYEAIEEFLKAKPGYQETFIGYHEFFGSIPGRLEKSSELLFNRSIEDVKISTGGIQPKVSGNN